MPPWTRSAVSSATQAEAGPPGGAVTGHRPGYYKPTPIMRETSVPPIPAGSTGACLWRAVATGGGVALRHWWPMLCLEKRQRVKIGRAGIQHYAVGGFSTIRCPIELYLPYMNHQIP